MSVDQMAPSETESESETQAGQLSDSSFKQTEFGLIPKDWHLKMLGELVLRVDYGSSTKSKRLGRCPVLRMGNIDGGILNWDDLVFTDDLNEINKYRLHPGDLLFNRTNTAELVGKTAIFRGEQNAIFAGYLIRVEVNPAKLDSRFANYILNTEQAHQHGLKVLSMAVGQANINAEKLRNYPIPLPPSLAEQEAIAEALGDADSLVEALEQWLAKKQLLKQATMQQLLSGKKRLPGFYGDWHKKRLGDLAVVSAGGTPSRSNHSFWNGDIPWVTTTEIDFGAITTTSQHITRHGLASSAAKLYPAGTLLMALY
jgi:type I restriction enzyme S subunit